MQAIAFADDVGTLDSTLIPIQVDGNPATFRSVTTLSLVELGKRLLESAKKGDTDQVRALMSRGAPFTTDWLGISPLHYAAQYGHVETAEVLLRAGISRDARTKVERTPLHVAAQEGNTAVVELLLTSGAEVDSRDMLRMTPLHWAVERENVETISVLLSHGADPNCISKFNKTAFTIALDNGRDDILQILQSTGRQGDPTLEPGESLALQQATLAATQSLAMELAQAPAAAHQEEVETTAAPSTPTTSATEEPPDPPPEKVFIRQERKVTAPRKVIREISSGQQTLQLLQAHGITMLPADESTLVASAVESGQTVVLTEAGRLALGLSQAEDTAPCPNSRPSPKVVPTSSSPSSLPTLTSPRGLAPTPKKKVITIRAGPLLMPHNKSANVLKRPIAAGDRIITAPSKVVVKAAPRTFTLTSPIKKSTAAQNVTAPTPSASDLALQLESALREVQAYKELLSHKEREAEQYRLQLQSMTQRK